MNKKTNETYHQNKKYNEDELCHTFCGCGNEGKERKKEEGWERDYRIMPSWSQIHVINYSLCIKCDGT